ncbi:hypothetical protein Clacol_001778 [Clathrus columnatus]|uniref:Cns1/TTC4 wheel domain-containing protein n=1 Tax=Clathrus columnatus TaxID=1419009 RepID=A0AAV5A031_9AGAM|nr:hypothetical protein Clacol_001778 [Clathrus columnatus]
MASLGPEQRPEKDIMEGFDNIPLFMRSLPDGAADNVAIDALQSLVHEGTPDEVAENFKESGNEYFKGKRWSEARGFYTQGIDAEPTNPRLMEALLCNRAACNLELQNYGSVLRDCSKAITLNPRSSKAYYRSALALRSLRRFQECIDCCTRCLAFDPDNAILKTVLEHAVTAKITKEKEEKEHQERLKKEIALQREIQKAYWARNIIIVDNENVGSSPYSPNFLEGNSSIMVFTVFFLYPQYATSDVISQYDETVPFTSHLKEMFSSGDERPTWDQQGQYVFQNLVVYAITHQRRILKVGKKMNLSDVFKASGGKDGERDGLELKNGCLSFIVLPKGDVEQNWIQDFKDNRDKTYA